MLALPCWSSPWCRAVWYNITIPWMVEFSTLVIICLWGYQMDIGWKLNISSKMLNLEKTKYPNTLLIMSCLAMITSSCKKHCNKITLHSRVKIACRGGKNVWVLKPSSLTHIRQQRHSSSRAAVGIKLCSMFIQDSSARSDSSAKCSTLSRPLS